MSTTPAHLPYPYIPPLMHDETNSFKISDFLLIKVDPDKSFAGAQKITLLCGTHHESLILSKSNRYKPIEFYIHINAFRESGYYQLFYVLTGAQGEQRYSPACRLFIDLGNQGDYLPELTTLESEKTPVITTRHLSSQGLPVSLMSNDEFSVGEQLYLEWLGFDISGVMLLSSLFTQQHTLGSNEIDRKILFFIPQETLDSIHYGRAQLSYCLKKRNGVLRFSTPTDVLINFNADKCLPAPQLPEANDGLLSDYQVLGYGGTVVVIPLYWQMQVGDTVTLYWKGYRFSGQSISGSDVIAQTTVTARDFIREFRFVISTAALEKISVGTAKVFYTVHSVASGEELLSAVTDVDIDMVGY